ncbi:hypothetical protein RvY_15427-1 [Ramazzottius varieornatus]|uniref:Major facilitator superfamily (MFS) profile domain-containing protein n=1 Tax=Ramazzottius varieornatus TaxID=947166 RepID=A0A1D1VW53_RAMVA|nr:hypothetical protein RvY_15427-1 [Ramazzottius varieornatus]
MIGAPLFGYLSDYYGRRVVILISLSAAVILGVGTSFALSYSAFVALRFFLGLALQGTQVCFVLLVEWLPVNKRSLYGVLSQWIWAASVMFLALLGFIFPNWNDLQLAISLIALLLVMAYFFFVKESIRWLILENRIDDASDSINRVLRTNHKASEMNWEMQHELVSIASYMQGQLPDEKPAYTLLDCFRPTGLRRTSICMMYIWFSCGIGYYGLFFATAPLVDNLAINVFINGLLELVPCLISLIVVPQYGRKQPMVIWSFLGGFSCILSCLVRGSEPSMDAGRTALIIIGRMALSGSFCCFLIWTAELYPTVLRGNGIGVCMFALRLGGVLAPQLLSLVRVVMSSLQTNRNLTCYRGYMC